jgi:predicted nucleic acid-binding protein
MCLPPASAHERLVEQMAEWSDRTGLALVVDPDVDLARTVVPVAIDGNDVRSLQRFLAGKLSIAEHRPDGLAMKAWDVAEEFGWAKTYDAEYVALAMLNDCRLVTVDGRLRRGADRLGFVVTPAEL